MRGRGRHRPGVMNKLETKYAAELEWQRRDGQIFWYAYESVKFKLADKTFYTPDFMVMKWSGDIELHEVKGFWEEDARIKIKCAADKFPFMFSAFRLVKGTWQREDFG